MPMSSGSCFPLELITWLCDQTGSGKIQDGGRHSLIACFFAPRQDSDKIPTAKPMFFGSSIPTGLVQRLCNQTGSGESKMAASVHQMHVSPLPDKISTKFQRLCLCFRGIAFHWDIREDYAIKPELEKSKMAAFKLQMHVSPLPDKISTKFQPLYLFFRCLAFH